MTAVVIDASLAISWCLKDEATPETDALFDYVRDGGATVPSLWYLEVANVLLKAEKRRRLVPADVMASLELLTSLPIVTDHEPPAQRWREVLALARADDLTAYDASYLELAVRRGLTLLTKDRDLANAARRLGVTVLPGQ